MTRDLAARACAQFGQNLPCVMNIDRFAGFRRIGHANAITGQLWAFDA